MTQKSLLGIHIEETRIERDTCTPMFIAALFTIARTWKQLRCLSADKWIRKLCYIYTMEYNSDSTPNEMGLTGVNVTPPRASDWLRNRWVTQFWPRLGNEIEGFSGENVFVSKEATAKGNLLSSVSLHHVWTLHVELP